MRRACLRETELWLMVMEAGALEHFGSVLPAKAVRTVKEGPVTNAEGDISDGGGRRAVTRYVEQSLKR